MEVDPGTVQAAETEADQAAEMEAVRAVETGMVQTAKTETDPEIIRAAEAAITIVTATIAITIPGCLQWILTGIRHRLIRP